jgi:hypothetical protein
MPGTSQPRSAPTPAHGPCDMRLGHRAIALAQASLAQASLARAPMFVTPTLCDRAVDVAFR